MTATAENHAAAANTWLAAALLLAAGAAAALTEMWLPSIIGVPVPPIDLLRLLLGILAVVVALGGSSRSWRLPWRRCGFTILLAFFGCLIAGWIGGVSWPNSGDEYSYVFLADTFRAGRLWDPPPPVPLLFSAFHVLVKDGRTFSPYPPAWSALLVPFRAMRAVWLANPLLTAALGATLVAVYRRLGASPTTQNAALCLVLLSPFTLFLGGSLFPQTMAAVLVAAIVWAQLTDEARPRMWNKPLIGALFGVLLLARYDVFAVAVLPYAIDRLVRRRLAAIRDGLLVMLGLLPFALGLLAYNAAITGSVWQLTSTWADSVPSPPLDATQLILQQFGQVLYWFGGLAEFAGLSIMVLVAIALIAKLRWRTCRFYDFMLPAMVVFYACVPFSGGHQYGPRYWFWAWPLGTLTIMTGLADASGYLVAFGRRIPFQGVAVAALTYSAAGFCILLATTHGYIAARREVFDVQPPAARAVVLLPNRMLQRWWWPELPAPSRDFTRNDINYSANVLYGLGILPDAVARACRLPDRAVFRWEAPGHLVRVPCG